MFHLISFLFFFLFVHSSLPSYIIICVPSLALTHYKQVDLEEICDALNSYLMEYLSLYPHLLSEDEMLFPLDGNLTSFLPCFLPLHLTVLSSLPLPLPLTHIAYDDKCFNETLQQPEYFPVNAILFIQSEKLYKICEVIKDGYTVITPDGDILSCLRYQLCFSNDSLELHMQRIVQAITRRSYAISYMKYSYIISNVPYDNRIITVRDVCETAHHNLSNPNQLTLTITLSVAY